MKNQAKKTRGNLIEKMNLLLSDYQIYYQNLRSFHWLIQGPRFYQLHTLFEDLYTSSAERIDEIAERILIIGGLPYHTFNEYMNHATLKAELGLRSEVDILPVVIQNSEYLLESFRDILADAAELNDEGTVSLMSELIGSTEKFLWMLKSMSLKA